MTCYLLYESVWDVTLISMYMCAHTYIGPMQHMLRNSYMGDVHRRLLPVSSFAFLAPSSSFLQFLRPLSLCFGSLSLISCFLGGGGAECLWSINPLNAIKHTMHRRWPFNTDMHSLLTCSGSHAIRSSPSCTSALWVLTDCLIWSVGSFFRRDEK